MDVVILVFNIIYKKIRMTTSISSEARKNQTSILGAEKIAFPLKPDRRTYGRTDGQALVVIE